VKYISRRPKPKKKGQNNGQLLKANYMCYWDLIYMWIYIILKGLARDYYLILLLIT